MKKIEAGDFIPLNIFEGVYPVVVDLVYACKGHPDNRFPGLYHADASLLWMHQDLLPVVLLAAKLCHAQHGWLLKVNDGFRPVEAQQRMAAYGYDPQLVSSPGAGAHPRGMAVDLQPVDRNGEPVDMGTPFDYFTSDPQDNPAARDRMWFTGRGSHGAAQIRAHREALTTAMRIAAEAFGQRLLPLPQEWWDFRFEEGRDGRRDGATYWGDYEPVSEKDLPAYMRLVEQPGSLSTNAMKKWRQDFRRIDSAVLDQEHVLETARSRVAHEAHELSVGAAPVVAPVVAPVEMVAAA